MELTNEILEKFDAALADEACVKALRDAEDSAAVCEILKAKGLDVGEEFAQALIQKRDAVLAGEELDEMALEYVAGGKGFWGMLIGGCIGAAGGMAVGGPCGAVFGGLVGAIVGGLA